MTTDPYAETVALHGVPLGCIHAIIGHIRDALKVIVTLPRSDVSLAVEEALTEALDAAESWAIPEGEKMDG